jgi:hypothetical protein
MRNILVPILIRLNGSFSAFISLGKKSIVFGKSHVYDGGYFSGIHPAGIFFRLFIGASACLTAFLNNVSLFNSTDSFALSYAFSCRAASAWNAVVFALIGKIASNAVIVICANIHPLLCFFFLSFSLLYGSRTFIRGQLKKYKSLILNRQKNQ